MIIEKIYKTDDGHTFKTEKEALAYEAKIKEERRKKAETNKKLSDLEKEWRKKLDEAVEVSVFVNNISKYNVVEFTTYSYDKYYKVTDLADLEPNDELIITYEVNGEKRILTN